MIEKFRYTSDTCEECHNVIVQCIFKGERYCLQCGLIQEDKTSQEDGG